MINFHTIIGPLISMVLYIISLAVIFYLLLFIVLPTSRLTTTNRDFKIIEHAIQTNANISYGDSSTWKYLRETILRIQGDKCLCCGKSVKAMHIDHIKPKSKYPHLEYMIDNLQVLCPDCNRAKSYTKETDYRKADHLIALLREVNSNKLLQRKYVFDFKALETLTNKRFHAEMKNKQYPQVSTIF